MAGVDLTQILGTVATGAQNGLNAIDANNVKALAGSAGNMLSDGMALATSEGVTSTIGSTMQGDFQGALQGAMQTLSSDEMAAFVKSAAQAGGDAVNVGTDFLSGATGTELNGLDAPTQELLNTFAEMYPQLAGALNAQA